MIDIINTINGSKNCNLKNRDKVALSTENPPHSHLTYGIADNKSVITVAPQKDIWPHGNTYPRNVVTIIIIKTPIIHVYFYMAVSDSLYSSNLMQKVKVNRIL